MWCVIELQLPHDPDDEPPAITNAAGPFSDKEAALTHYFGEDTMLRRMADKHPWPDWFPIGSHLIAVVELDHPMRVLEGGL